MQVIPRSCGQLAKGLTRWKSPQCSPWVTTSVGLLPRGSMHPACVPMWNVAALFSQFQQAKDFGLPNSSWSRDMMAQYEKFVAMSKDGTWKRMPNHKHLIDDIPKQMRPEPAAKKRDGTRCFLRNVYTEGLGFEFVMFFSASEKRVVSIFQPGLYLEGLTGYMHGGAIATILDNTLAACSLLSTGRMITANLSINYRSPVPLGSVVLVDTKVDRTEGRKTFVSGQVQSVDGQVLHVDATALCIKLESKNSPQQQARSSGSPEST